MRGRRFKIITDHRALECIRCGSGFKNKKMQRWIERLREFEFEMEYWTGEENVGPDALSGRFEEVKKEAIG